MRKIELGDAARLYSFCVYELGPYRLLPPLGRWKTPRSWLGHGDILDTGRASRCVLGILIGQPQKVEVRG